MCGDAQMHHQWKILTGNTWNTKKTKKMISHVPICVRHGKRNANLLHYKKKKKRKAKETAASNQPQLSAFCWQASLLYFSLVGGLKAVKRQRFQLLGYSQSSELLQSQRTTPLWRKAAAPNHFRTSLSLLFRQLFPGPTLPLFSPTRSTRLTLYLTAATLVCVAVDGEEEGSNRRKKRGKE